MMVLAGGMLTIVVLIGLIVWTTLEKRRHHHQWPEWSKPETEHWYKVWKFTGQKLPGSEFTRQIQRRTCETCGLYEEREVPKP